MDDRGVLTYLGHRPRSKESTEDTKWFPMLLELAQRDWTRNDRSGPFAHLAEALNGVYSAKAKVLMRERSLDIDLENSRRSEAEPDTFRTEEASARNVSKVINLSRNPESRETSQESWGRDQKPECLGDARGFLQRGKLPQGRKNIEKRGFDWSLRDRKIAGQEVGKGVYAFADVYFAPQCKEGEEKVRVSSWLPDMAGAERSMQIKLGKSVSSHGIIRASSPTLEEVTKPPVQYWEQLENVWEYDFSEDPLPDLLSGRSLVQRNSIDASLQVKTICLEANRSAPSFGPSKLRMQKLSLKANSSSSKEPTILFGLKINRTGHSENEKEFKLQNQKKMKSLKRGQVQRARIIKQLLCGGFAGVISRTAVAPLDLIKTHLITSHGLRGAQKSALTICKEIVEQSGWRGLFRGNFVNCIRVAPNKAIELFVFETVRRALNKEDHPLKNLAATIAGGAAGMAGTIATYPLELIRTRLSVQPELYSGPVQAMAKIIQEEGFIAFYSGLSPSLVGAFPYAATNYFVYDGLRTTYCRSTGRQNVPTIPTLVFAAVSAAASSAVTYPLEVARRQMQLALTGAVAKGSSIRIIQDIYRNEGFFALYRGLGTTWLKLIPAAGISFMCYEAARLALCIDDASIVKPEGVSAMGEQELDS